TREIDAGVTVKEPWMLRVIDAPAAIAGRGFPAAAELTATVVVEDAQLPVNTGTWQLTVSGGKGTLAPAVPGLGEGGAPAALGLAAGEGAPNGAGPLRLGARGFAALYAGVPVTTLRLAGLAAGGDPVADAALGTAFGGTAFMLDYF
ncbi:MAG: sterol carrier protein domain-containing protein, partial [Actinomycetota bacterium]